MNASVKPVISAQRICKIKLRHVAPDHASERKVTREGAREGGDAPPASGPEAQPGAAWCPTSSMGSIFFRLPNSNVPNGEVYGLCKASAIDGDQSGMRIVGYGVADFLAIGHREHCVHAAVLVKPLCNCIEHRAASIAQLLIDKHAQATEMLKVAGVDVIPDVCGAGRHRIGAIKKPALISPKVHGPSECNSYSCCIRIEQTSSSESSATNGRRCGEISDRRREERAGLQKYTF